MGVSIYVMRHIPKIEHNIKNLMFNFGTSLFL